MLFEREGELFRRNVEHIIISRHLRALFYLHAGSVEKYVLLWEICSKMFQVGVINHYRINCEVLQLDSENYLIAKAITTNLLNIESRLSVRFSS